MNIRNYRKLARMGRIQFQLLLASRQIPINYGIEDFETDLKTLRQKSRFLA
jgi:predicted HTH domain antitoxin